MDKDSLIDILSENTSLKKADIEGYAEQVSKTIANITKEFDSENENRFRKKVDARVADFFNATQRKELDYNVLKRELLKILDNPKEGLPIIKNQLGQFDSDKVRALVTNNKYIKQEHIDGISQTIEDSKNEVLDRFSKIENKANQKTQMFKCKALIQAEHTRKTAASAAWWLVISAAFSGSAALLCTLV